MVSIVVLGLVLIILGSLSLPKRISPQPISMLGVIDRYLANEVSLGRVLGPFPSPPLLDLHVSSFGVIPKRGQPGKWRLIVDLSSPGGLSVNDGINPEDFSLHELRLTRLFLWSPSLAVGL